MNRALLKVLAAVVAVTAGLAGSGAARGEQVTYYVDPARSSLTLSGISLRNNELIADGVGGGLTTSYTGTLSANRDLIANTLQFTGGNVVAKNGSGTWFDRPADYLFAAAPHAGPGAEHYAIIGFAFSATSAEITSASNFNVSQLSIVIQSGELDFATFWPGIGSVPLSGNLVLAPASVTLLSAGGIETLMFPIDTDFSVLISAQGSEPVPLPMHLSGTLVAVAPEPGSLTLLILPGILMIRRVRVRVRSERVN
jgi:hypothetical protein